MRGGIITETASPQFVRALGERLTHGRGRLPLALLAVRSRGHFSRRNLREAELGLLPLDLAVVTALAATYRVDISELLPSSRSRLVIRPQGLLAADGRTVFFEAADPNSIVASFVRLVLMVRGDDEPGPRQGDVRTMAEFMDESGLGCADADAVSRHIADGGVVVDADLVRQVIGAIDAQRHPR